VAYSVIENFSSGVDRSRPMYALPAGTLWECINAHISRGGDIEKRKAFTPKYHLPVGQTIGLATTANEIVVFGSAPTPIGMPAGVTYQRLRHPDGSTAMTELVSYDLFDGKVYAVARFSDGRTFHYYDGEIVTDWYGGIVRPDMVDNAGIAEHLRELLDSNPDLVATRSNDIITIEKATTGTFSLSVSTENGGNVDDQELVATRVTVGKQEVLARVNVTITGGGYNPGVSRISALSINGVSIISEPVDWQSSNENTAYLLAEEINSHSSVPDYTAEANGATVTIYAAPGTGSTPNGYIVSATVGGTVTINNGGVMASGVTGSKEKWDVQVAGTFEVGDKFDIFINDEDHYGFGGNPHGDAAVVKTHKRKIYSAVESVLYFSGVDTAVDWNVDKDPGAGYANVANHNAGSDRITGLAIYQDKLAIFARRVIQIWYVGDDAGVNSPVQIITETGTRSPRSVRGFGDLDVFYLADTGVRSLRARDTTNTAGVQDVGTPIDPLVREWINTLPESDVANAVSVVEPQDGRFWIAIGSRIFVFTYFPTKRISAWTWYEPGFRVEHFATQDDRVYARSGDTIYLYGGDDNQQYDNSRVTVVVPFLDLKKPASSKQVHGVDIASKGKWYVELLTDPEDMSQCVIVGDLEGVTYTDENACALGNFTHVGFKLVNEQDGFTSLSNISLAIQGGESE
jgi:hypothetical protein